MKKNFYIKLAVVAIILIFSLFNLLPTFKLMNMSPEEKKQLKMDELERLENNAINLGLDLRGGMHLVLEVNMDKLSEDEKKDAVDRALEVIRNRIDQFGVAEPLIQREGQNRIIVQLPGLQNPERAVKLIGQTALLEFKIVQEGQKVQELLEKIDLVTKEQGLFEKYNITSVETEVSEETETMEDKSILDDLSGKAETDSAADTTEKKLAAATDSASSQEEDSSKAVEGEKETTDSAKGKYVLARITPIRGGKFTNYFVKKSDQKLLDSLFNTAEIREIIPNNLQLAWSSKEEQMGAEQEAFRQLFVIKKKAEMTGAAVEDATPTIGQGYDPSTANRPIVNFEVKSNAVRLFSQITGSNLNRRLAIVLDEKVVSAPELIVKIRDGKSIITGSENMEEAKDLSIVLRSGALPAEVKVIQERTVGPTLGVDSIRMGKNAALIGLVLVIIFMLIYYRLSGLYADIALFLNIMIVMAAMAYINATLTLPGIAGLILTIGMAVDANVLIFERIREEADAGKPVIASVDNGFERARWTIFDSNITTLITALVLYNFGTGPIKGFAVTLSIGIISSMFTALVVSKLLFDFTVSKFRPKKLSI